jgi:hypothetical protein
MDRLRAVLADNLAQDLCAVRVDARLEIVVIAADLEADCLLN